MALLLVLSTGCAGPISENNNAPERADRAVTADADHDGLSDEVERTGWVSAGAVRHRSSPQKPDTDGDGLTDAEEADIGSDPSDDDSDRDGLHDGFEIGQTSTSPLDKDTDEDGFEDGYEDGARDSRGLDPLSADGKVAKSSYVIDFAKGAVLGDLDREDSLAWLSGNLTASGLSFVPVVGWVVGALADVRDLIGSALRQNWVGSGFAATGVVPVGGDAVALPGKAAAFVTRNPELATAVAALVAALVKVPEAIKVRAARGIYKGWDELHSAGASNKALLRLQSGRTNLDEVAAAARGAQQAVGPKTTFLTWRGGEKYLTDLYRARPQGATAQVRRVTGSCDGSCTGSYRVFDVLADGVAHESKVGRVAWSSFTRNQIRKDAWLVRTGAIKSANWHFLASQRSNTIGADPRIFALLDELRLSYTIHLPATA